MGLDNILVGSEIKEGYSISYAGAVCHLLRIVFHTIHGYVQMWLLMHCLSLWLDFISARRTGCMMFLRGGIGRFAVLLAFSLVGVCFNNGVNIYRREFGSLSLLYYPLAFIGIGQLVVFSMLLNRLRYKVIETLSTGSIAIMGLHGVENLFLQHLSGECFMLIYEPTWASLLYM